MAGSAPPSLQREGGQIVLGERLQLAQAIRFDRVSGAADMLDRELVDDASDPVWPRGRGAAQDAASAAGREH